MGMDGGPVGRGAVEMGEMGGGDREQRRGAGGEGREVWVGSTLGLRYVQLGSVERLSLPVHQSGVLGAGMDGGPARHGVESSACE